MRLVVDTNILVAELLRQRGRNLLASPRLELYLAEKMRDEFEYEFTKRMNIIVGQGRLTQELATQQVNSAIRDRAFPQLDDLALSI